MIKMSKQKNDFTKGKRRNKEEKYVLDKKGQLVYTMNRIHLMGADESAAQGTPY